MGDEHLTVPGPAGSNPDAKVMSLVAGMAAGAVIDIDDTVKAVYGPGKQGAQFGNTKIRGLNAQLATISTARAAPGDHAHQTAHPLARTTRDQVRLRLSDRWIEAGWRWCRSFAVVARGSAHEADNR